MPLYEYQCVNEECEHETEINHPMAECNDRKRACPECGKRTLRRAFKTPPKAHLYYSPMAPRVNRGRGY